MASTAPLCLDHKGHFLMSQTLFGIYCVHTLRWVCLCLWKVPLCRVMGTDNIRWLWWVLGYPGQSDRGI